HRREAHGHGRPDQAAERKQVAEEAAEIDRMHAEMEAEMQAVNEAYMANEITQEEYDRYYHSPDDFTPPGPHAQCLRSCSMMWGCTRDRREPLSPRRHRTRH